MTHKALDTPNMIVPITVIIAQFIVSSFQVFSLRFEFSTDKGPINLLDRREIGLGVPCTPWRFSLRNCLVILSEFDSLRHSWGTNSGTSVWDYRQFLDLFGLRHSSYPLNPKEGFHSCMSVATDRATTVYNNELHVLSLRQAFR